jgi:hypothetical protein
MGITYTHTDDPSCQKNHFNEDFLKNRRKMTLNEALFKLKGQFCGLSALRGGP